MTNFKEIVLKYSRLDEDRLVILPTVEEFAPTESYFIVYIFAAWSAASIISFSCLTSTLSLIDFIDVNVYVVNIDGLTPSFISNVLKEVPEGWGETFWVKNRKIEHKLSRYTEKDAHIVKKYTLDLLTN